MKAKNRSTWIRALVVVAVTVGAVGGTALLAEEDAVSTAVTTANTKLAAFATKDARSAINSVADQATKDARVAAALGRVLEQERSYDDAVVKLKKAAELAPDNGDYLVYLGEVYVRQRKNAEVEATFKKLEGMMQPKVQADPKAWEPRYLLGIAQMRRQQLDKAAESFAKVVELRPDYAMGWYHLGYTRALQQRWGEAVERLTTAIEKDSNLAYAYYYRGLAQDKVGKKDKLVLDMDRFVKLAPGTPEAERAKGILDAAKR